MVSSKEKMLRRVYVLPTSLVERIVEIQKNQGFSSEVDVVRWLLEGAVWQYDTAETIFSRFRAKISSGHDVLEATKECLVGHPRISDFSLKQGEGILVDIIGEGKFRVDIDGAVWKLDKDENETEYLPALVDEHGN